MQHNRYLDLIAAQQSAVSNKRRPLDWRYRFAFDIASGKRDDGNTDPIAIKYADMLAALHEADDHITIEKIARKYKDYYNVHAAYVMMSATDLALTDALLLSQNADTKLLEASTGLTAKQRELYRQFFLDIDDRRDMSLFIASQLLEAGNLRGTARGTVSSSDPESAGVAQIQHEGKELRVLRVFGYYTNPIVVEMLYGGLVPVTIGSGSEGAMRFIANAYSANIRRQGLMSVYTHVPGAAASPFLKMAQDLCLAEGEQQEMGILQNIEMLVSEPKQSIGFNDVRVTPMISAFPPKQLTAVV